MAHILLIGQPSAYPRNLIQRLRLEGHAVSMVTEVSDPLTLAQLNDPDMVLLSTLPFRLDGIDLCRRIRAVSAVPILFLSVGHEPESALRAFEAGADVYLQQPVRLLELLARVKAGLRRPEFHAVEVTCVSDHHHHPERGDDHAATRSDH